MSPVKGVDFGFSNSNSDKVNIELNLPGVTATGGDQILTPGNGYKYHIFTTPGTFTVSKDGYVDACIVAGGGGGGKGYRSPPRSIRSGGGGGAGGMLQKYGVKFPSASYTVSVGSGGAGGGPNRSNGSAGSPSYINSPTISQPVYTATGGGYGGRFPGQNGQPGGSGGGGAPSNGSGGPGIAGQGNNGSSGTYSPPYYYRSGGGGGAGASASSSTGGAGLAAFNGDTGIPSSYGTPGPSPGRYFAGGGAGLYSSSSSAYSGSGGYGGGGNGNLYNGGSGTTNSGGGGGSSTYPGRVAGTGGPGIVIIRYRVGA